MRTLLLLICLPVLAWSQDSIKVQPKAFTVTFTVTFDSLTLAEAAGYESEFRWRLPKNCTFNVTVGERVAKGITGTGWLIIQDTTALKISHDSLFVGVDTEAK